MILKRKKREKKKERKKKKKVAATSCRPEVFLASYKLCLLFTFTTRQQSFQADIPNVIFFLSSGEAV